MASILQALKSLYENQGEILGILAAVVFLFISFYTSYKQRNDLVIDITTGKESQLPESYKKFTDRVREHFLLVSQTHMESREAASDMNIYRDLAMPPQGEGVPISSGIKKHIPKKFKIPLEFFQLFFKWLFRPPKISGQVLLANYGEKDNVKTGDVKITCTYASRHKHGGVTQIEPVERSGVVDEDIEGMAKELALKIILVISKDVGIKSWQALDAVTDALNHWPEVASIKSKKGDTDFSKSEAKLKEALKYDKDSPLVNYNLGLISYYEYGGKQNIQALEYFDQTWKTNIRRYHYLGKIGLARCYCQNYHRFGKQTEKDLARAREVANEAVELIEKEKERVPKKEWDRYLKVEYARALYCRAFAQHVTEKNEDLDKGKEDYFRILELYCEPFERHMKKNPGDINTGIEILNADLPEIPAVIYNNLGYIIMARGGRFKPEDENSTELYRQSKELLNLAIRKEPEYKFAYANLANIERLLKNYDDATKNYKKAIEIDPGYANGYSELAWVYLEAGHIDDSKEAYKKALECTELDSQKSKIKEYYARIHFQMGKIDEAKKLVIEAKDLDKKNENLELLDWISRHDELKHLLEGQ